MQTMYKLASVRFSLNEHVCHSVCTYVLTSSYISVLYHAPTTCRLLGLLCIAHLSRVARCSTLFV